MVDLAVCIRDTWHTGPANSRNIFFFCVSYCLAFSVLENIRQDSGIEGKGSRLQKLQNCNQLSCLFAPLMARKVA